MDRVFNAENKKNAKTLSEFYKRISFASGYENLAVQLKNDFPAADLPPKKLKQLCTVLRKAMLNAGIFHSNKDEIILLTNDNALDYDEWDGNELYVDSKVKIVFPAWYQQTKLIEKGFCSLLQ